MAHPSTSSHLCDIPVIAFWEQHLRPPPPNTHRHTHARTHTCAKKQTEHNAESKCQSPCQLSSQTRQSMFAANRCLSAGTHTHTHTHTHRHTHTHMRPVGGISAPPFLSTAPPPPPRPWWGRHWWGGNCHFVNHHKIACCTLKLLCVAPLLLLPTHCIYCDRTCPVAHSLMDFDSTTLFPPRTDVIFICSTNEPTVARVIGHSEHGDVLHHFEVGKHGMQE